MNPEEAMNYFGVDLEVLEALVLEHNIDVEVNEQGELVRINADECKQPLFVEHQKKVGYLPDDPKQMEKMKDKTEKDEAKNKVKREVKRSKLVQRVSMRGHDD